jgi:hypothetical protein
MVQQLIGLLVFVNYALKVKMFVFWDMASWALIMEAVNTSEILVTIYQTS